MTAWLVRPATAADGEAIARLIHALNAEEGGAPGALTAAEVVDLAFGPAPRFAVLLAEQGGETIGYALHFPSYETEHAAKGCYLQDLYVVPEARRQGVGRALMAAVARACAADGGCYVFWNARTDNRSGLAFYRAIGARQERVVTLSLQGDALDRLAES